MRPQAPRVVRQRKLNKSVPQPVLREDQIESAEFDSLQNQQHVETGVERSEENEYHLQAALAANSGRAEKHEEKEIPAPPAQESIDIKYDELYAEKYERPNTYIRFSDTVEEACGCQYDMTTEDDTFLRAYNEKKSASARCSELDFEKIMDAFELTAQSQAPYAAVDNTVVPLERMKPELLKSLAQTQPLTRSAQKKLDQLKQLKQPSPKPTLPDKFLTFAKDIYEHWRECRRISSNNPIQPSLKREIHQENDDADPYVCFRRRDVRPARKTRARDVQSTDKLKRLRKEIEDGRGLVALAYNRERVKQDLLSIDKDIYLQRKKLREAKIRLGIKGDDEDLINQKPQKRKISDFPPSMQRPPAGQIRLPQHVDGRTLNTELVQLHDVLLQKERELRKEIEEKTMQHRIWNANHIDVTREPLSPVNGQGPDTGFRPATAQYQYLMTPPSSVTSEPFDQPSPAHENHELTVRYSSPPEEEESRTQPAYRRRIGRGGRLWIDRRGMSSAAKGSVDDIVSDRFKYDQDDDDEQPVYEVDPLETKHLRFRATIPFPPHLHPQHPRPDNRNRPAGSSPQNNRTVAAVQQQPPAPAAPT